MLTMIFRAGSPNCCLCSRTSSKLISKASWYSPAAASSFGQLEFLTRFVRIRFYGHPALIDASCFSCSAVNLQIGLNPLCCRLKEASPLKLFNDLATLIEPPLGK